MPWIHEFVLKYVHDYINFYIYNFDAVQSILSVHQKAVLDMKVVLCLVHVIWTECRMSKLVLNVKYLLMLSFLTAAQFYNLGHIQGIKRVH